MEFVVVFVVDLAADAVVPFNLLALVAILKALEAFLVVRARRRS